MALARGSQTIAFLAYRIGRLRSKRTLAHPYGQGGFTIVKKEVGNVVGNNFYCGNGSHFR